MFVPFVSVFLLTILIYLKTNQLVCWQLSLSLFWVISFTFNIFVVTKRSRGIKHECLIYIHDTLCAVWYNLCNFKKCVKQYGNLCLFLRFLSCTNGTKSRKTSHIYLGLGTIIFILISQKNQRQVKKKLKEMLLRETTTLSFRISLTCSRSNKTQKSSYFDHCCNSQILIQLH